MVRLLIIFKSTITIKFELKSILVYPTVFSTVWLLSDLILNTTIVISQGGAIFTLLPIRFEVKVFSTAFLRISSHRYKAKKVKMKLEMTESKHEESLQKGCSV